MISWYVRIFQQQKRKKERKEKRNELQPRQMLWLLIFLELFG